jgi:peptidoglycan/LPS O-acetylase OafA/YrhL
MPALDGLRGVAVLSVVGLHLGCCQGGNAGVTTFFVLSGFLISYLLITELDTYGRVNYQRFYLRRALRLIPALLAVLAVHGFFAVLFTTGFERKARLAAAAASLFYSGNLVLTLKLFPMGHLSHTWSLAVEEQFYLIWPFVLVALARTFRSRKALLLVILLLGAFFGFHRLLLALLGSSETRLYTMIDSRADALLLGAAVALLFRCHTLYGPSQGYRALGVLSLLSFIMLLLHLFLGVGAVARSTSLQSLNSYTITAVAAALVIYGVSTEAYPSRPVSRVLEFQPLPYLGKISYGVYLWHYVIFGILDDQLPNVHARTAIVAKLVITLLVSVLSYHFLERPFLRLKDRFANLPVPEDRRSALEAEGVITLSAVAHPDG